MPAAVPAITIRIPRVESTPLEIGNHLPLTFICGPCQLESRGHALETRMRQEVRALVWLQVEQERQLGETLGRQDRVGRARRAARLAGHDR